MEDEEYLDPRTIFGAIYLCKKDKRRFKCFDPRTFVEGRLKVYNDSIKYFDPRRRHSAECGNLEA